MNLEHRCSVKSKLVLCFQPPQDDAAWSPSRTSPAVVTLRPMPLLEGPSIHLEVLHAPLDALDVSMRCMSMLRFPASLLSCTCSACMAALLR